MCRRSRDSSVLITLFVFSLLVCLSRAWISSSSSWSSSRPLWFHHPSTTTTSRSTTKSLTRQQATRIAVPASELDADLTKDERTVVSVVRNCGPSVAYVCSVLPFESEDDEYNNQQSRYFQPYSSRRRQRRQNKSSSARNTTDLPRGQSLGTGSGFVVDADGYIGRRRLKNWVITCTLCAPFFIRC